MTWLRRFAQNIRTRTVDKKETPDGLWTQCPKCKTRQVARNLVDNAYVCSQCDNHLRIGSDEYFYLLFDEHKYTECFPHMESVDVLKFTDIKAYSKRLEQSKAKTGLTDALKVAVGLVEGKELVVCCMDFRFIGGSMGAVVGEKISKAIDICLENKFPLLIISKSGGARMMEAGYSLMQMAKTSAKLSMLAKAKLPYISLMTDPTTGGVTASFAMLGDVNIAEPNALIGFAGPRVIKETIRKELPEGFQRAETLLECGFLDQIIHRKYLKKTIVDFLDFMG
ncbi:UNVERIFIED_CONTAM: hypothetical protein GTU68_025784 [Idotea baltica]|nr:hypothetical protein [Idotea baltica]